MAAVAAAAAAAQAETPPNQTVYVRNLEENVNVDKLVEALREIFSEFGTIIDIVAKKSLKRKGQAFIVYDDVDAAQTAIDEVQGFELFDKPMSLDFAKTKSDAIVKRDGTSQEFDAHKRRRLAEKERKQAAEAQEQAAAKRPAPGPVEEAPAKTLKGLKSTGVTASVVPDEYLPPNRTLFVQNLPEEYDMEVLTSMFERFEGFIEVRSVPGRNIAFVEYDGNAGAISAKENTAGTRLGDQQIKVTYQRQ
ncbi:MAG: hypothetical protein M1820_000985 [Bogoriella megaspora]|nr:MAG: hypothetical protein M1820_000985 [Bogoriella megaspora]